MEYIKIEEFLQHDREVQKVFFNWWKPKGYDLYMDIDDLSQVECLDYVKESDEGILYYSMRNNMSEIENMIPLLNEGQLRKFIEDKNNRRIIITEFDFDHYNIITWKKNFITKENQLLQAYWKVALQIAGEECK